MGERGTSTMKLPAYFVQTLLQQLEPFCKDRGHVAIQEAEPLVGRAGRVSYVVPEVIADPFLATQTSLLR